MNLTRKSTFTKKNNRLLLIMALSYIAILLLLSSWWAYLMYDLSGKLGGEENQRVIRIITWEGGTFLVVLLALFISFIVLYLREEQKTKSLQAFFAGLTHELKTPLASIRLQAEVLSELVGEEENTKLITITKRMGEDVSKLETQMDKILQLSRLERGGPLSPVPVKLLSFFQATSQKVGTTLEFHIQDETKGSALVSADEFALELIFKNLLENTKGHTESQRVNLTISKIDGKIHFTYADGGTFAGDPQKLGELFYKHNSSRGSGIGLYLISTLMNRMQGEALFDAGSTLKTTLAFHEANSHE